MPAPKVIALKGWNHKKYIQKSGLAHPPKKHRTFDYETYMFCNQKSYVYISKHLYFKNGQLSVPQRITIGRSTAACRSEINRQYTVQPNARFLFSIFVIKYADLLEVVAFFNISTLLNITCLYIINVDTRI